MKEDVDLAGLLDMTKLSCFMASLHRFRIRRRIGALAAMDEAGMRALQGRLEFFVARMKSGERCPLPVAATTAWMQEVERSRMLEPRPPVQGAGR